MLISTANSEDTQFPVSVRPNEVYRLHAFIKNFRVCMVQKCSWHSQISNVSVTFKLFWYILLNYKLDLHDFGVNVNSSVKDVGVTFKELTADQTETHLKSYFFLTHLGNIVKVRKMLSMQRSCSMHSLFQNLIIVTVLLQSFFPFPKCY